MPYYFKINQHIEKSSGNKYLMVAPTNGSKGTIKMYEEMLTRIRDFIRSKTNNSEDYDEKYMKIKFNSNQKLPLNKTLKLRNMIVVVRFVFYEGNRNYPQVFKLKFV